MTNEERNQFDLMNGQIDVLMRVCGLLIAHMPIKDREAILLEIQRLRDSVDEAAEVATAQGINMRTGSFSAALSQFIEHLPTLRK